MWGLIDSPARFAPLHEHNTSTEGNAVTSPTGTSTRYALLSELDGWLSQIGYDDLLDADMDGTVKSDEQTTYGSAALNYACSLIDGAICNQLDIMVARSSGNIWLKDRCIDIAVWRLFGYGGRDIPASVQMAYDHSLQLLEGVKDGDRIPGYVYPTPIDARMVQRSPRVVNIWRP